MIFFQRRRLIIWLLKAYIKRLKKTIFVFFGLGLIFFFVLYFILSHLSPIVPFKETRSVGILGIYNISNLPEDILNNVSSGLTYIDSHGKVQPAVASDWKIEGGGKNYTFHINKNLRFTDGTKLTSKEITYNFENVQTQRPDKYTVVFKLRESYSPFLVTVSRPILKNAGKFIGLGNYKVTSIKLNGEFVNSIELSSVNGLKKNIIYQFYPTEESLKTALVLGEISETQDVSNLNFKNTALNLFSNYNTSKRINFNKLATLFYNTQGKALSDKRLRQALSYAIPNDFGEGRRNITPYPPEFWADRSDSLFFQQDLDHSKLLLAQSSASSSSSLKLNIKTLPKYKDSAEKIKSSWEKLGIISNVEVVDTLPSNFEVFLGEFFISKDPDQYALWHSGQPSNITGYKSLRIDKLLEDGRQIADQGTREKIYADFQKYLLDDSPASFLFFPYNYVIIKK